MVAWFKYNEADMEADCVRWAENHGLMMIKMSPKCVPGIPDQVLFGPKRLILFFEFKLPTNKNNKKHLNRQRYIHKKLRRFGFSVHTVKSKEVFKRIVNIHS